MSVVYKYPLPHRGRVTLSLPVGAKILHVASQASVTMWLEVEPGKTDLEQREFQVIFTGMEDVPENSTYCGTAISTNGLVSHVFELPR